MARYKRTAKGKKINPTLFIFCEGESEEIYIRYLRNKYRLPVEIVPRILKNRISERLIREKLRNSPRHEKDQIFLMYDIDVVGFHAKLLEIQKNLDSELLLSNPCFELWYILHYCSQPSEISTEHCLRRINALCSNYLKGSISSKLKEKLDIKVQDAIKRAKKLELHKNPSTNIYKFIEKLDQIKSNL